MNRTNLIFGVGLAVLAIGLIMLVGRDEEKLSNNDSVITTPAVETLDYREAGEPGQETATDMTKDTLGNPNPKQDALDVSSSTLLSYSWVWRETRMNDGTVISPKQAGLFVLTFDAEGSVSGQTDCNGFGGSYTVTDGVLSMSEFMMTMMYCEGSQEMEFQKMLSEPVAYMFTEKEELVLMLPFDSGSVIFEPKR